MPVFALYNFDTPGTPNFDDEALGNGNQNGLYLNGAAPSGGQVVLDGVNDIAKIYASPEFQLDRGTLEITFSQSSHIGDGPNTVLSRDSNGEHPGGYHIDVLANGAIQIVHETEGGSTVFTTPPGFLADGDKINVVYSWDQGGAGGQLQIQNLDSGADFNADVPPELTMDMGSISQPWMIGTGQSASDPSALNNLGPYFNGSVDNFSLSDTVDNIHDGGPDGIVEGTGGGDYIDVNYTGDPNGDFIDRNDAILPGDGPNDDRVYAYGGNDTVLSGEGSDIVYGGSGDDLIDTRAGGVPLPDRGYPGLYPADADPNNDLDTVFGGRGEDTILTGDDRDEIHGGAGNDSVDAGFDDDTVYGDRGDDTIVGGEGSDVLYGGLDNDLIYGGYGPGVPDNVNIRDDQGDLRPDNGMDTIFGGQGNDTVFGMDDRDEIHGGFGTDSLDGGIDNDTLFGDRGNDTLIGGQGEDSLFGGADRDLFIGGNAGDFVDGNEGGDDYDTLDLSGSGPLQIVYDTNNPENGTVTFLDADRNPIGTLNFVNIENVIPCFTPGTLIATPKGEVAVETLKAGDRIITRDNGIQEIRWVGAKAMGWQDLAANPHLQPVLIKRGSLGEGLPERDMMVSPNHRMLVANDRTALYFDEHEVLVSAKHLVGGAGVHAIESMGTTYIHFMFDRHEVVLANGAWTESFQPGDYTLKGMGNAQRSEIFDLFPDLKTDAGLNGYSAARRTLKKHEALLLVK